MRVYTQPLKMTRSPGYPVYTETLTIFLLSSILSLLLPSLHRERRAPAISSLVQGFLANFLESSSSLGRNLRPSLRIDSPCSFSPKRYSSPDLSIVWSRIKFLWWRCSLWSLESIPRKGFAIWRKNRSIPEYLGWPGYSGSVRLNSLLSILNSFSTDPCPLSYMGKISMQTNSSVQTVKTLLKNMFRCTEKIGKNITHIHERVTRMHIKIQG